MANNLLNYLLICIPIATLITGLISLILWRKNLLLIIIALEICFISSHIGLILTSIIIDDAVGFIFSLIGLTLAGAEISLGLALTIIAYRKFDTVYTKKLEFLKS